MKAECLDLKKEKRKFQKKSKRKGLLSTWNNLDSSSLDEEKETSEQAHIALMAKTDSDSDEESKVKAKISKT